jgi:histidinol-phosphate/aromatic aminotransferase/cobyric acid decarboxylase-like protein
MLHGGEIYDKEIELDFSVSLNPYPCPEEVKNALRGAVCDAGRYPDMEQRRFREAVARAENVLAADVKREAGIRKTILAGNVIGGNGASELIFAVINMIRPRKALLTVPSFYGYIHCLNMAYGCEVKSYQLSEESEFELDESFKDSITDDIHLVILGNPNNPTGKCIRGVVLESIIQKCRECNAALLVDECFFCLSDYGMSKIKTQSEHGEQGEKEGASATEYIGKGGNLYVVNAYTKLFSIPGVRVGYCLSSEDNISRLKKVLPEWNLSVFAETAGVTCANIITEVIDKGNDNAAASDCAGYIQKSLKMISAEREYLSAELKELGIKAFDSDTNYFMIKVADDIVAGTGEHNREGLYRELLKRHILIRDCSTFEGLSEGYYRIAVKDHVSNCRILEAISEIIK